MNRFKVSKFRHTEARPPRREAWISNIRAGTTPSCRNHIKSSCSLIAFNSDCPGVLGIVPLQGQGEDKRCVAHLGCHSGEWVKLWRLPGPSQTLPSAPGVVLGPEELPVEVLQFHPTSDGVLVSASGTTVKVWDVANQQPLTELAAHGDLVQSALWSRDGALVGTVCKDKQLRIFDPRAKPQASQSTEAHENGRDSRLAWTCTQEHLVSTGFNQMHEHEVKLWDTRLFSSALASLTLDTSFLGELVPGCSQQSGLSSDSFQGERQLYCYEVVPQQPALSPVTQCVLESVLRGAALVPRQVLAVMSCEVLRVLQLSDTAIVPISYHVPRKAVEFHEDLFPDTASCVPASEPHSWWAGDNQQVQKVSLNPACRPHSSFTSRLVPPMEPLPDTAQPAVTKTPVGDADPSEDFSSPPSSLTSPSTPSSLGPSLSSTSGIGTSPSLRSLQSLLGPSSKFRHAQGTVLHRDSHITNLKGLNLTTPGECDGFCANKLRVAVPLLSSGGQVAVLELRKPGRLPDTALPTLQNGAAVTDLAWDPFDPHRLAVGGEDARIRLWRVPPEGLKEVLTTPEAVLTGHMEKICSLRFHPLAADVLASSSYDLSVRIWDLQAGVERLKLQGHRDQIFSLAWSPDGQQLATVCRDGRVRVYRPLSSPEPLGPGWVSQDGGRGARIVWVCDGRCLLVSGFDSRSERQILLYEAESLAGGPLAVLGLDVAPSTLLPSYDSDTGLVLLTGKGDTRVFLYELLPESPFFLECNSFTSADPHKGFALLPKTECDVREVEFMRCLRLRQSSLEPVAFRLPRVRKEFFQDDVFPDTAVSWEPVLSAEAWLQGATGQPRLLSLQPPDMSPGALRDCVWGGSEMGLLNAMVAKLGNRDDPLPQDSFEGVDEDEWVSGKWPHFPAGSTIPWHMPQHAPPTFPGPTDSLPPLGVSPQD
uniref:Coronin n=1 Tax=Aotus nancymaae TaxID=37293 RepID=A0A2K5BZ44_AOTNA